MSEEKDRGFILGIIQILFVLIGVVLIHLLKADVNRAYFLGHYFLVRPFLRRPSSLNPETISSIIEPYFLTNPNITTETITPSKKPSCHSPPRADFHHSLASPYPTRPRMNPMTTIIVDSQSRATFLVFVSFFNSIQFS